VSVPPTVGVIVPVRDGVDHLGACLEGVLAQVPRPGDIVVIDGGSTDGSAELAASFTGVRVVAQAGSGLGGARNEALQAARGDLVAFCDSDDRWPADSLARRIEHLTDTPGCDAVIGRVMTTAMADESVPEGRAARLGVPVPGYTPGALLARREVFDGVGGFDEQMHIGADSDWFVRLALSEFRLDMVDPVVLLKGVRTTSLSTDVDLYRRELLAVARAYVGRRRART
jgi:glycosyltransferase involved in cell wall biosynthesis